MSIDWIEYFDQVSSKEKDEFKKAGWGSKRSQFAKFNVCLKFLNINPSDRILDIGCGPGSFLEYVNQKYTRVEIIGIDISSVQLKNAKKKIQHLDIIRCSATHLPFKNKVFNKITCFGVITNLQGQQIDLISETNRTIKKDGEIFFQGFDKSYRGYLTGERKIDLRNTYHEVSELVAQFETNGFIITKCNSISDIDENGVELPLHETHTFFIAGRKNG